MKKTGTLNSHLSRVIAQMGHGDKLVVCDCGLPIPRGAEVVDLALTKNVPSFADTLSVILEELKVESAVIAEEMERSNANIHTFVRRSMKSQHVLEVKSVTHDAFKLITQNGGNIAFVRTGEATPYANIILVAGVDFD